MLLCGTPACAYTNLQKWWLLSNHMLLLPQFIQVTIECLAEVSNDWDSVFVFYIFCFLLEFHFGSFYFLMIGKN